MKPKMDKTSRRFFFAMLAAGWLAGCSGDPRLAVKNTYTGTVFYEITTAGDASAYLSGQIMGQKTQTLTLRVGKNLMLFVKPDTTGGQENFITLDSLLAEEGKKYLLELNPQFVSGHQHGALRVTPAGIQSGRNPLR